MKNWKNYLLLLTYLAILIVPHLLGGGWWDWPLPIINK